MVSHKKQNLVFIKSANFYVDISDLPLSAQRDASIISKIENISVAVHRAVIGFSGDDKILKIAQDDLELDFTNFSFEQRYLLVLYSFIRTNFLSTVETKSERFKDNIIINNNPHYKIVEVKDVPDIILNNPIKLNALCNTSPNLSLYFNFVALFEDEWSRFGCLKNTKFDDFKENKDRYFFVAIKLISNFELDELENIVEQAELEKFAYLKNLEMFIPLDLLPTYIVQNKDKLTHLCNLSLDEILRIKEIAQNSHNWSEVLFDGHKFDDFKYLSQRMIFVACVFIDKNLIHLVSNQRPINFFSFDTVQ